jgi:hypothetical protein
VRSAQLVGREADPGFLKERRNGRNDLRGQLDNLGRTAIRGRQVEGLEVGETVSEAEGPLGVGPSEGVDGLTGVAHDEDGCALGGQ